MGSTGGAGTYYSQPQSTPAPESRQKPEAQQDVPPSFNQPSDLPKPEDATSRNGGRAILTVSVPSDAKVFVNGNATSSTGSRRQYVSRGLADGFDYTYEVRVEAVRDGKKVQQSKTVQVRSGGTADLAFDLPKKALETTVTLHVPEDAKVYLGGNETTTTGAVRTFTTTALSEGAEWSEYRVRVEVQRQGKILVRDEVVSLKAGDQRTLRLDDFDSEKVADAR